MAVELSFDNAAPITDIGSGRAQLKQGFVSVHVPEQPVLSYSKVAAIVLRIERTP